ncbi:hypothetical protein D9757_009125 [Collybiopsis confluens]|uniref:DUF6533 domain-containing protein n=1 Tax=Collybiopsis confluens TaxID=2823264 RepID=A0A8H5H957_9AGAR|nr:hypothetical protein D9757_009125 [Collybiopsis confluens]
MKCSMRDPEIYTALWVADYFETLSTEVETIWGKKLTGTSVLFIFNRYSFLLILVVNLVIRLPGASGDRGFDNQWLGLLAQSVYAISSKSRLVLVPAALLIVSRLAMDIIDHANDWNFKSSKTMATLIQLLTKTNLNLGKYIDQ